MNKQMQKKHWYIICIHKLYYWLLTKFIKYVEKDFFFLKKKLNQHHFSIWAPCVLPHLLNIKQAV